MRHAGRARDAIPRQLYFCYAIFARALWRTRVSWCSATAGAAVGTTAVVVVVFVSFLSLLYSFQCSMHGKVCNIRKSSSQYRGVVNCQSVSQSVNVFISQCIEASACFFGVLLARSFLIIYRPRRYHEEEPRQQQPERNGSVGRGSNRLQLLTLSCGTWQGRIPSIVDG
ncbi:hypothetical protein T10_10498 [Trichinella papuae]|uniref:Uncharacterized protein n=1 Tax=Trichinella papuae TaxID=268474 RepID=A0A0V1MYL6_9BILA|nr:hypothetical protein T10_10498 [Trichinella papuae]